MTENTFQFELVSPAKKLIDSRAWQVVLPGQEGDLGVRAGHAPFVVAMRPGCVRVTQEKDGASENIFVAGGFADISATPCTILAEEALAISEVEQSDINSKIESLLSQLRVRTH